MATPSAACPPTAASYSRQATRFKCPWRLAKRCVVINYAHAAVTEVTFAAVETFPELREAASREEYREVFGRRVARSRYTVDAVGPGGADTDADDEALGDADDEMDTEA